MQVVSSITITAAEPSIEPALATVSKSILMSICVGREDRRRRAARDERLERCRP